MIRFSCPTCGKLLQVHESLARKSGKCPGCGLSCQIPAAPKRGVGKRLVGGVTNAVRFRRRKVESAPAESPVPSPADPQPASVWSVAWAGVWASAVTRLLVWLNLAAVFSLLLILIGIAWEAWGHQQSKGPTPVVNAQPLLSEPAPSNDDYSTSNDYTAPSTSSDKVQVRGYYRKDGTYVRPHERSRPHRK